MGAKNAGAAQTGVALTRDQYDRERYRQLPGLAAQIWPSMPVGKVQAIGNDFR